MLKSIRIISLLLTLSLISGTGIYASDATGFEYLQHLMDSARTMGASTFAPNTMGKAESEYSKAESAVSSGKQQKFIDQYVAKATEYTENAIRATEVAKLSLNEYLEPRNKALAAKSVTLVPELYMKAEQVFVKAAAKVESGDVKGGLKEAAKTAPLYDVAELEAIRVSILGTADALIAKAVKDEANKYAVSTLDKARTARAKADAIITSNRYNRAEAEAEAKRSEYEARHASNIALSVRSLSRNDQAWEKLMLVYEIQMNRVGETIGATMLPFDNGPLAAADSLIHYIKSLQTQNQYMTTKFTGILGESSETGTAADPQALADKASEKVEGLFAQNKQVSEELEGKQARLTSLEHQHQNVTAELSQRQEREEKLNKAKTLFTPSEGQVFFNASNDIVLRLTGLSFDVGKAYIKDSHVPLLMKVQQVVKMFPNSNLVVEGHTDGTGSSAINMTLSEKRAYAIMQFLRQSMQLSTDRIKSIGYGPDKPVASNQTKDGRAQNRRIDIVIMIPTPSTISSAE
jgi:outer membrane protein OmpA-like peptidoglycan-associated protein